jgi:HTH-type transcriptional regulator, sugar sensing transcriptional regulator
MADDAIMIGLADLGLTSDESAVYRILLRRCSYTPVELALKVGIPRQRVNEAVDSLEEKGLCQAGTTTWRTWVATEPALSVTALRRQRLVEIGAQQQRLQEMAADVTGGLQVLYEEGCRQRDRSGYVDIYRDPLRASQQLREGASDDALVREWVTLALSGALARAIEEGAEERRGELLREIRELHHLFPEDAAIQGALAEEVHG